MSCSPCQQARSPQLWPEVVCMTFSMVNLAMASWAVPSRQPRAGVGSSWSRVDAPTSIDSCCMSSVLFASATGPHRSRVEAPHHVGRLNLCWMVVSNMFGYSKLLELTLELLPRGRRGLCLLLRHCCGGGSLTFTGVRERVSVKGADVLAMVRRRVAGWVASSHRLDPF